MKNKTTTSKSNLKDSHSTKRYRLSFADKVTSQCDKQELLIEEYEDSLIYEPTNKYEEDPIVTHLDTPTGPPINPPVSDSDGGLHWIAIAEESDDFNNATYYQESGDVSKLTMFNLNIRLAKKKKGKLKAYQYIEEKGLDIILEDYISAIGLWEKYSKNNID